MGGWKRKMRDESETALGEAPARPAAALHALILDDSEPDRYRLIRFGRKAGLELHFSEAGSIDAMRRELDAQRFDIVFLDFNLGVDTGLDALAVLQAHPDHRNAVPIMLTSVERSELAADALQRGCADYLEKDRLTADALARCVRTAMERRAIKSMIAELRSNKVAAW